MCRIQPKHFNFLIQVNRHINGCFVVNHLPTKLHLIISVTVVLSDLLSPLNPIKLKPPLLQIRNMVA